MAGQSQSENLASKLFAQGNFHEAYIAWKQILALSPTNQRAQEGLQKLKIVGENFFEEALMLKGSSPDECRKKINMILAISDPGSQLYIKAHDLLGKESV